MQEKLLYFDAFFAILKMLKMAGTAGEIALANTRHWYEYIRRL
jgi:hypothetical protein